MKSKSLSPQPITELAAGELAAVHGGAVVAPLPVFSVLQNFSLPAGLARSYVVQAFRERSLTPAPQIQPEQGPARGGFGGPSPFVTDPLPMMF
jgi:hypothetical protein